MKRVGEFIAFSSAYFVVWWFVLACVPFIAYEVVLEMMGERGNRE